VIHPYPTQAEAIWKAANQYNRARLKPWLKRAGTVDGVASLKRAAPDHVNRLQYWGEVVL
jgi:hypothetical protein